MSDDNQGARVKKVKRSLKEKVKRLYSHYGIDVTEMEDDEYIRILDSYKNNAEKLDADLKKSEKLQKLFSDDDII